MNLIRLNEKEKLDAKLGEPITLTAVLTILASAVIAVIVYKLFISDKGTANVGGWKFTWN